MSSKVTAYIRIARTWNSAALGALYLAALWYTRTPLSTESVLVAFSWFWSAALGYAYNDVRDVAIDRVNRPRRPLVVGELNIREASVFIVSSGIAAVVTGFMGGSAWPLLAAFGALLYSAVVRYWSALGANVLTAALVTLVPLSALWPARRNVEWMLLVVVFGVILARELQKDIVDAVGDMGHRPVAAFLASKTVRFIYGVSLILALACTAAVVVQSRTVTAAMAGAAVMLPIAAILLIHAAGVSHPRNEAMLLKTSAYAILALFVGAI
jgi:4-hydroxybenzoate polyprenyltransferase